MNFEIRFPFRHGLLQFTLGQVDGRKAFAKELIRARRRVERNRDDPRAHLYLMSVLLEANEIIEAVKEWREAMLLLPRDEDVANDPVLAQDNAWAHYLYGCLIFKGGAQDQAIAEWEKAALLDQYGTGDMARKKLKIISDDQ